MKGFVKVRNDIFEKKLSAKALYLYVYMLSSATKGNSLTKSVAYISSETKLSDRTVRSAISELVIKNIISKKTSRSFKGNEANCYSIKLIAGNREWFAIPRSIFNTAIKAYDFMVYCYITMNKSGKTREAFPSINAISAGTGLSKNRVVKAIKYLRQYTFLNRVKRHYKRTRAYRHNRYIDFKCNSQKSTKKIHPTVESRCILNKNISETYNVCTYIIMPSSSFVKHKFKIYFLI